jgi:two-component system chemotaxis sensor kinase CheA
MDDLTREFLIESQEGLDRMERCLTDLEERPEEKDLLSDIFRSVHTIKGTTGFLGFKRLEKLAHTGENLLGLLRDGKLVATPPIITGLLELLDGLRGILKIVEETGGEGEDEDEVLIEELKALQELPGQAAHKTAKSAAKATKPKAAETKTVEAVKEEGSPTGTAELATRSRAQLLTLPEATEAPTPTKTTAGQTLEAAEAQKSKSMAATDSTLRVDVTLLNRMMNLVGELVLTRNQILQATAHNASFTLLSRRLDMVTADLRESVMKARMQPVSNVFSKFPRIIRDLSQVLNRKVRLVVEGQETELDKSLLEAIKDPLTHAVRNSMDHGIEPPDVRVAAGKDAEGTLKMRAYQESSHVIIEVSDDGAGIRVEKVRNKAIERGLITAERATQLNDRELLQLIFLPGFSTAEAVTNVSGRGVGMDVVRTNVEKIGGKVELESKQGKGTTLRLRIPLTLAIVPALIVKSRGQSFALPQGALSELVHIPPERYEQEIEWMEGAPLYRLRGNLLPLVFLERMLKQGGEGQPGRHRDNFIAVLEVDGRRYGLVVDGLADPEEIVVKPLSTVLKSIGLYTGATVLGSGDLALILDPGSIATRAGVQMNLLEDRTEQAQNDGEGDGQGAEYLVVEAAARQAAVALSDVLRIERIPVSRVEYVGCLPVLNFEGQLLPVEDAGGILRDAASQSDTEERQVTVVVCRDGNRHVGLAVSAVLDVSTGSQLKEAGTDRPADGVTLLKDHVTSVVSLSAVEALPEMLGEGWSGETTAMVGGTR